MINTKQLKWTIRLILFLCFTSFQNCSSSDPDDTTIPNTTTPIEIEAATNIEVSDRSNNGDASDIFVEFSISSIDGVSAFNVYVGEEGSLTNLSVDDFNNIPNTGYLNIPMPKSTVENFLSSNQTDVVGNSIIEGKKYQIIVMTVAEDNQPVSNKLSSISSTFTLTKQNEVTTVVTNLPANDALVMDEKGNIYASNFGNWSPNGGSGTKVIKITQDGTVSDHAVGLKGPLAMHYNPSNGLYVINDNNGTRGNIIRLLPDGEKELIASINGWPGGIAEDDLGNLYISNYSNATLHKINTDKSVELISNDSKLKGTVAILYHDNHLYIANYNNGKILKSDLLGNITEIAQLSVPANFGIGYMTILDDHLYASGIGNHIIFKIGLDGEVEQWAGTGSKKRVDGLLHYASFFNPNGIIADEVNNVLYVLDWGSPALRKIQIY